VNYSLTGTATNGTDYNALGTALDDAGGCGFGHCHGRSEISASYVSAETVALALSANPALYRWFRQQRHGDDGRQQRAQHARQVEPQMKVTWHSVVGKIYRVASKNSLGDPTWMDLKRLDHRHQHEHVLTPDTTASTKRSVTTVVYVTN